MNKVKQLITICNKTNLHFKQILKNENKKYMFMGVQGGGCNGFKYNIYPSSNTNVGWRPVPSNSIPTLNGGIFIVLLDNLS